MSTSGTQGGGWQEGVESSPLSQMWLLAGTVAMAHGHRTRWLTLAQRMGEGGSHVGGVGLSLSPP